MRPPNSKLVVFPVPAWLAEHSNPLVEFVVEAFDPRTRRLYRRYLADEVRQSNPRRPASSFRALDRAVLEAGDLLDDRLEDGEREGQE